MHHTDSRQVGLFAQVGSDVRASGLRITGATYAGVVATGSNTILSLESTEVSGTRLNTEPAGRTLASGLKIGEGAHVTGRRVVIADNAWLGVLVDGLNADPDRSLPDLQLEDSVVRANRYNRDAGNGGGLTAQRGADVRLERTRATSNEGRGLMAIGATLAVIDSVLEDTASLPQVVQPGRMVDQAQNILSQDGATVTVFGVLSRGGRGASGAVATSGGSELAIRDSVFEGPDRTDWPAERACLVSELGGRIVAERVVLRRCLGIGAYVQSGGASLTLTDSLVQGTRGLGAPGVPPLGRGLSAFDTASMMLARVLIEDNAELGVVVAGVGTSALLSSVVIRNIRALPDRSFGQGLFAQESAIVEGRGVLISGTTTAGLYSTDRASVTLTDSLVADVHPSPLGGLGDGMDAINGSLTAERVVVRHAFSSAVTSAWTNEPDSVPGVTRLRDVIAYDLRGDPELIAGGTVAAGLGMQTLNGAQLEAARVALFEVTGSGVEAALAGARPSVSPSVASITDLFLRNVRQTQPVGGSSGGSYSFAVVAREGGAIDLTRGAIDLGAWGFVLDRGAITARDVVVSRQSQGLGMSSAEARDTRFAAERVDGRENLQNMFIYNQRGAEIALSSDTHRCATIAECRASPNR